MPDVYDQSGPERSASESEVNQMAQQSPNTATDVLQQQKADRIAEFNAHPHTRLTALATDLGTKRVDLHDRIGAIHRVLAGLIGMALQNTPAPHRENEDGKRIERHDAVGPEGQGTTGG